MSETQGAERKARREALGWDWATTARAMAPHGFKHAEPSCIGKLEFDPDFYAGPFLAAYDAALTAEETRRREVGAKLAARREALGLDNLDIIDQSAGRLVIGDVNATEDGRGGARFDACAAAYTTVLDEAEARRGVRDEARRVLAKNREAYGTGGVYWHGFDFIGKHLPDERAAWCRADMRDCMRWSSPATQRLAAALAKLAEEPEPTPELVITDEMRADARRALEETGLYHFARTHLGYRDEFAAREANPMGTPAYEALRTRVQAIVDS